MMTNTLDCIRREVTTRSGGSFKGKVDGDPFLSATEFMFHNAGTDYFIAGNQDNKNWVVFAVPASLEGDGPHVVKFYDSALQWDVVINDINFPVDSGEAVVTFYADRRGVEGTINFMLKDKRNVTGEFNIANE